MLGHPIRRAEKEPAEVPETPVEHFNRTKEGQRQALEMRGHPSRRSK